MTIKEKLYREYLELDNELKCLKGQEDEVVEITDDFVNSYKFKNKAATSTKDECRHDINYKREVIKHTKEKMELDAWFTTPEGTAYKSEREQKLKYIRKECLDMQDSSYKTVDARIKEILGNEFGVTAFGINQMKVGLIKTVHENYNEAYFGHEFSVYYEVNERQRNFEVSCGSIGAFDVFENRTTPKFIAGMAKFVSDVDVAKEIRDIIREWTTKEWELTRERYRIERELANPPISKEGKE